MSIVEGTVKSVLSDADISQVYYQPSNTMVYAVGSYSGIVKKSLAQIILSLRSNTNVYWDQISDSDVSRLKFNKIVRQGSWLIAIGEDSAVRESTDGTNWIAPTGLAYVNSWGSLLDAAGNTFYLLAVGGNGAIALRNLSTNSAGASFYNWQLLAANDSLTDQTLRAVANPPGTNEFLVAGDNGVVFKFSNLDLSYAPTQMLKDDPEGVIDPLTKKVKKVNFTTDNIIDLVHNGSYYLALAVNQNNTSYSIYRSSTGEATSWTQVHNTTQPLTSLIWSSGVGHWLVTKSNANRTRGGLLTSTNGTTWTEESTLASSATSDIDIEYQNLFTLGDQSIYLFGPNKITLLGVAVDVAIPEIAVSTNLVTLPITNVGSSNQQSIVITNSGSANLIISGIGFQGANASSFSLAGCSSNTIIPGGSCTSTITFAPADYGAKTAELFINHNASDLPEIIYITGEAAEPKISIGLQQLTFDRTAVGAAVTQNISINNIGSANLNITSRTITGANASEFSITGCTGSIAPGAGCTLAVSFSPTTTGGKSASIVINHNAAGGTNTIGLIGEGYVSELIFAPETLTLPGTTVGNTYTGNISATNTGTETITISNIVLSGANASEFTSNVSLPLQITGGATQTMSIAFTPSDAGSRTAQLSAIHTGTNTPGIVYLVGNGVESGGVAEYEGAAADYFVITYTFVDGRDLDTRTSVLDPVEQSGMLGWGRNGQIGTYLTWGGDNTGTGVESVLFNTVAFKQAFPGKNTITLNFAAFWYGTVGATPISIDITSYVGGTMVGGNYSWNNPTATTTNTNFIRYQKQITRYNQNSSNNGQQIVQMVLDFVNGTIQFIEVPVLSLSTGQINFGNISVGTTNTQNLRITNQGSANLVISNVSLTNTSDYSISSSCSTPVIPESYCDISVTFAPGGTTEGARSGNLTIEHNATGSPSTVVLDGSTRIPRPALSLSSTSVTFDSTRLTTTSTKTVTVTNTGDATLVISNIRSTAEEFTVSGCTSSLAANENCTLTIQFSPTGTSLSSRLGTILIDSNADTVSRSIDLTGPVDPLNPVVLLLNMNGANGSTEFIDSSDYARNITVVGGAQLSASVKKYGSASAQFDGPNDALTLPTSTEFNFGAGDFTIEFWAQRVGAGSAVGSLVDPGCRLLQFGTGDVYTGINLFDDAGNLGLAMSSNGTDWDIINNRNIAPLPLDQWAHIAITRAGSSVRTFVNGVVVLTLTTNASLYLHNSNIVIGGNGTGPDRTFNGYIDDLRIVKGQAVYTYDFIPPTSQLTTTVETPAVLVTANIDITLTNSAGLFTVSSTNDASFITLTETATVPLTINSTNDASFITLTETATVPLTITSNNDLSFITLTETATVPLTITSNNDLSFITLAEAATVPLTITSNNISVINSAQSLTLFTVSS